MFLTILLRMLLILAINYLIVLLLASWLISLFQTAGNEGSSRADEPVPTFPSKSAAISQQQPHQKRWVLVDESYYLEEFALSHKHSQD